jgi:PEP-CTERM motif
MLTPARALGATLLCFTAVAVHCPAQAAQWRIVNATVDQLSLAAGEDPSRPLLHLQLPNAGAPFQDGQYVPSSQKVAWAPGAFEGRQQWYLKFSEPAYLSPTRPAPSIDLANMQAHFDGLELMSSYGTCEYRIGCYGWANRIAALGTDDPVAITQVGSNLYSASWSVRSTDWTEVADSSLYPLYSVNLTFVAFPEGTPWSVPEPSSVFMVLAGLGAVVWARRRQISRPTA